MDLLLCSLATAGACALAGCFLVLRRSAMLADAISHSILPGLVAAYALGGGGNVALGMAGAAGASLLTLAAVDFLTQKLGLKSDSAIGLVFPTLFALGMVMVTLWFKGVHLDADSVLFGDLAFAPLERLQAFGMDLGPRAAWLGGAAILLHLAVMIFFRVELSASAFDPEGAKVMGGRVRLAKNLSLVLTAITASLAFAAAGAVMAVALLVLPATAAGLWTKRLGTTLVLALSIAGIGAAVGTEAAVQWDLSVGAMIVSLLFAFLLASAVAAPGRGMVARWLMARSASLRFDVEMLLCHLASREGESDERKESAFDHLVEELQWAPDRAAKAVGEASRKGQVQLSQGGLRLTGQGREVVAEVVGRGGSRLDRGHIIPE